MYTPYPHQVDAVNSVFQYYADGGNGHPVVAMPTATGKSLVIAELCRITVQTWPHQRIMCLTHVKELIEQNAEKIRTQWPSVPLGIFSAGLSQRDTRNPIIYGGVGSVVNCVERFGHRDLLLIDEAHRMSPKDGTNYQEIIFKLRKINPRLKVIGFTATPYRMGQGLLVEGDDRIFTDICYDITGYKEFNKLIADGYLCPPIPKATKTELNVTGVKITGGDLNQGQLQKAVDIESITYAACKEAIELGYNRQSWLAFASGIEHSEHVADILQSLGINALAIHSKMDGNIADERIKAFRAGEIQCAVNYGKLTTGFDHQPIDLILMLRPTVSTNLWVQMVGRGLRTWMGKENCLVLDFARNTVRLGPINDPVIPRRRVKGAVPGVAPVRICPQCCVYNHARATTCIACGFEFPKIEQLTHSAGTADIIRREAEVEKVIGTFTVQRIIYNLHHKKDSPDSIRVSYFCGLTMFSEYICFEHTGFAKRKAWKWWLDRMGSPVAPPTTADALKLKDKLREPVRIHVWTNKQHPEIMGYEYA